MYGYRFEILLSVLWDIHLEVGLLDHKVVLALMSEELPYCFPQRLHYFRIPPTVHKVPISRTGNAVEQ